MIVSFFLRLQQICCQPFARQRFPRRRWLRAGQYLSLFSLCFLLAVGCRSGGDSAGAPAAGGAAGAIGGGDRVSIGTTLSART
ncbi:MAG: hypothetical protein WA984_15450, partial [Phormidesmis sp.]